MSISTTSQTASLFASLMVLVSGLSAQPSFIEIVAFMVITTGWLRLNWIPAISTVAVRLTVASDREFPRVRSSTPVLLAPFSWMASCVLVGPLMRLFFYQSKPWLCIAGTAENNLIFPPGGRDSDYLGECYIRASS